MHTRKISRRWLSKEGKEREIRTEKAGDLVYSDTCGPFSVPDLDEDMYFQTYIDYYSRMTATF